MTENNSPSSSSSSSSSVCRLWRPAAQRNVRNQWSKLSSLRHDWTSSSSSARSHATSLLNAYLSHEYMSTMELGILSDVPHIRHKASIKLFSQQEIHRTNLLSTYRDMVHVVTQMVRTSKSMRCYLKGPTSSPFVRYSDSSVDTNDPGDGGGVPVFASWSISCFENFAEELVHMLVLELNLKRLLVVELVSLSSEASKINKFSWSDELYPGEFDDLGVCELFSEQNSKPVFPRLGILESDKPVVLCNRPLNQETLKAYLTTWIADVNIDSYRVDEIFATTGEEMHVNLS